MADIQKTENSVSCQQSTQSLAPGTVASLTLGLASAISIVCCAADLASNAFALFIFGYHFTLPFYTSDLVLALTGLAMITIAARRSRKCKRTGIETGQECSRHGAIVAGCLLVFIGISDYALGLYRVGFLPLAGGILAIIFGIKACRKAALPHSQFGGMTLAKVGKAAGIIAVVVFALVAITIITYIRSQPER